MQTTSVMGVRSKVSMDCSGHAIAVLTMICALSATWLTSMTPHIPSEGLTMPAVLG